MSEHTALIALVSFTAGLATPALHGLGQALYHGLKGWVRDRWSDRNWRRQMRWGQEAAAIERERVCREIEDWIVAQREASVAAHMFPPTAGDAIRHIRYLTWLHYPESRNLDAIQRTHEEIGEVAIHE
jgi:hypothetical protein